MTNGSHGHLDKSRENRERTLLNLPYLYLTKKSRQFLLLFVDNLIAPLLNAYVKEYEADWSD
jgi:hypothetical protein